MGGLLLVHKGQFHRFVRGDKGEQVSGGAEARPRVFQIVRSDQIQVLYLQLFAGVFHQIPGLHGKAAKELTRRSVLAQPGQDVPGAGQGKGQPVVRTAFFDLILCLNGRAVVGHGGGLDDNVLLRGPGGDRLEHILSGHHVHPLHTDRLCQAGGPGHQGHGGPPAGGGPGDGVAHPAGGVVGEIAHRVQRLPGGAGGDQHPQARHVLGVAHGVLHILQQLVRLGHFPFPYRAAGQPAAGRLDELPAVSAQRGQIVLGHRVFVHPGVHGGGGQLWAVAGQDGGGEHVVRQAVGQLGQHVGGGGSHQHHVRLVGQGDVLHLKLIVAVEGVHAHPVARQGLEGMGTDELGGVFRHQHLHVGPLLHQGGSQAGGLIAGDAAGDGQQHGFSL